MRMPRDRWLPLKDLGMTHEGRWESSVQLGPSSEWFSGHFDEYPLVPGVALLALAAETVKRQGANRDVLWRFPDSPASGSGVWFFPVRSCSSQWVPCPLGLRQSLIFM